MKQNASDLSPQYALLGFLYLGPMHGYDLHRSLEANLREVWRISQSQTYNILKRLHKEGLIQSNHQPQEKRPDRQILSLTEAGQECVEKWLYTPTQASARALRVELLTRLFFASQLNDDICSRLIQEQAVSTANDIEALNRRLINVPPHQAINRLGLDLRIHQLSVMLDWLTSCEATLLSPYPPTYRNQIPKK
jgi:DNA-binding PadR family transcriptional regulator